MTPERLKRRAEAVYQWAQRHHADTAPESPVCRGVKWVFRLETAGPFVPRVCASCGHVQLCDAVLLGVEPAPQPAGPDRDSGGALPGRDGSGSWPGRLRLLAGRIPALISSERSASIP